MAELKAGSTLQNGKYKILKTLGRGSFGITYLASGKMTVTGSLGRMEVNVNVTVKEFFMSDLNSRSSDGTTVEKTSSSLVQNYRSKFRKEAENLAKLQHPNIVKVLEVFEENNTAYYVMEFIDGETLDDYIKRNGRLSADESLHITREVCSALSYMHEHKMLHLDLKPKNIMRDTDGHIRLIDFGLAKQYNENGEPESSTTLGLGTPGYAPIEQAHYKQDGTLPVTLDIYALGATLYKMLTGQTPPESSYILNDGLSFDFLENAGISRGVISIVEKAMAPLRKDRYQTVEEFVTSLEKRKVANTDTTKGREKDKTQDVPIITYRVQDGWPSFEKAYMEMHHLKSSGRNGRLVEEIQLMAFAYSVEAGCEGDFVFKCGQYPSLKFNYGDGVYEAGYVYLDEGEPKVISIGAEEAEKLLAKGKKTYSDILMGSTDNATPLLLIQSFPFAISCLVFENQRVRDARPLITQIKSKHSEYVTIPAKSKSEAWIVEQGQTLSLSCDGRYCYPLHLPSSTNYPLKIEIQIEIDADNSIYVVLLNADSHEKIVGYDLAQLIIESEATLLRQTT